MTTYNDDNKAVVQSPMNDALELWTASQMLMIRNTLAPGISLSELALFAVICKRTGLDPFQKQIYAIKRGERMTIQTGIDGYRLLAARTGELAGIDDAEFDREDDEHPYRARVTVWRLVHGQRVGFTATARWHEYVQTGRDGKTPSAMWQRMPYTMLGKCAEALALRKGFPAELSGIYTGEEMGQADNPEPPIPTPPKIPTPINKRQAPAPAHSAQVYAVPSEPEPPMEADDAGERWPFIQDVDFRQLLNKLGMRSVGAVQDFVENVTQKPCAEARRADRTVCMEQAIELAKVQATNKEPVPASLEGLPVGKRGQ